MIKTHRFTCQISVVCALLAVWLISTSTSSAQSDTLMITQYYISVDSTDYIVEVTNVSSSTITDLDNYTLVSFLDADSDNWKDSITEAEEFESFPAGSLAPGESIVFYEFGTNSPTYATTGTSPNAAGASLVEVGMFLQTAIAIYYGAFDEDNIDRNNLVDVAPLNQDDQLLNGSIVRITSGAPGWDFNPGTNYTDFPSVWSVVTNSTVDNASPTDNEYLGFFDDGTPSGYASYIAAQSGSGGEAADDDKNGNGIDNKTEYALQLDNNGNTNTLIGTNRPYRELFNAAFVDDDATPAILTDDQFAMIIEVPTGVPTDVTLRVVASDIPNDDPDDIGVDPSTSVLATYDATSGSWTANNGTILADTPSAGLDTIHDSLPVSSKPKRFIYIDVNL